MSFIQTITQMENLFFNKKRFWHVINNNLYRHHLCIPPYQWDRNIFIPCALWLYLYDTELKDVFSRHLKLDISSNEYKSLIIATLATITAWRYTQGVYCFNEALLGQIASDDTGAVISPPHIDRMHEWSVCIDSQGIRQENFACSHFYVHKNQIATPVGTFPCLILLFCQDQKHSHFQTMPFVVLDSRSGQSIEAAILEFGFFPEHIQDKTQLAELLKPYLSLFNAVFDPSTEIESDIVGIKQPHHSNVEVHINYNQFNTPNFKYVAPSNIRIWHCGANFLHAINEQQRSQGGTAQPYWNRENSRITIKIG